MSGAAEIDAAEIGGLRQEITSRIGLMNAIVALELAALGTGLSVLRESTHVLAGLAIISSFLWLLWMDQSLSTFKIAAYLAIELGPRLEEGAGRPTLRWELFLRQVEAGGTASVGALYRHAPPPGACGISRTIRADWYVTLLFGGTSPVMVLLYVLDSLRHHTATAALTVFCAAAALIWLVAISRFRDFVQNSKAIDAAIRNAAPARSTR
ncbi:hypothetical protein [Actinomadura parmotrematis]|uniref:Uncharacterized protein n=1 Tax=Actinomadura parmotrematis TaxID=2864039 RepID=A0ABS7FPK1_9ACTN|nr:hypothetical protein [Actinomadura parmotrematis]MBW8482330.1 hypothetical protein [Actinomadura parmotrematis]